MEISIYSTIDFSKARNLLTERQKNIKAFNPIVPVGGCISLQELNPLQYSDIAWSFINEKTGKITATTAESSDAMHYVAIPEGLRLGTYRLKIVTTVSGILEDTITTVIAHDGNEYDVIDMGVEFYVARSSDMEVIGRFLNKKLAFKFLKTLA
jgi:hypothetical protein